VTLHNLSDRRQNLTQRRERTERQISRFARVESRFPWIRLAALAVGLLIIFAAFQSLPFLLALPVTVLALSFFVFAAYRHNRLVERMNRLEIFQKILSEKIARLELDWEHIPSPGSITALPEHPFAGDLYILGERSLHQLLDTSISDGGSRRLADWLLQDVPNPPVVLERQELVRDLTSRAGFRARLELNGRAVSPGPVHAWDTSVLLRWLEKNIKTSSLQPLLIALTVLAVANIILYVLNAQGVLPPLWPVTLVIYLGLQSLKFSETSGIFEEAYSLGRQIGQLRGILVDLEIYPYAEGSLLRSLVMPLISGKHRPSTSLRQINRVISAASLRSNPFLALVLNLLVPWDLFIAFQLERLKLALRETLPAWLQTWYELEGLVSIANFSALHPEYNYPKLLPTTSEPVLDLKAVGHPLIPSQMQVTNDFTLERMGEIILVTGSNMSGKSTFLRTIGANLVLAFAGSPVAAQHFEVLPFRLYTSMTVNDSLSDGISFFYAEVRRLKALLDQLETQHSYPLLFLIDEIFRGTNNREREIGSRAYTRALAARSGAGFLSTHDLDLVNLAVENPLILNYHFKESIVGDRMVFDYKIHPGASPTTNALRIMSIAGLPVPHEET
jgi:hypothetical protein